MPAQTLADNPTWGLAWQDNMSLGVCMDSFCAFIAHPWGK